MNRTPLLAALIVLGACTLFDDPPPPEDGAQFWSASGASEVEAPPLAVDDLAPRHPPPTGSDASPTPNGGDQELPERNWKAAPDADLAQRQTRFNASIVESPCPSTLTDGALSLELPEQARGHIQALLKGKDTINRKVYPTSLGLRAESRSADADVSKALQRHVIDMHLWLMGTDPATIPHSLYADMAGASEHLFLKYEMADDGILVEQTSDTADGVGLLHAHAQLVTAYLTGGESAATRCHAKDGTPIDQAPEVINSQRDEQRPPPEKVDRTDDM